MATFYTNVYRNKNYIYLRGFEDGKRVKAKIKFRPYLFRASEGGFYRTIHGVQADKVEFESMGQAHEFLREYKDVENVSIFGLTNFLYLYIYDTYGTKIEYDPALVRVVSIDIECAADDGFPSIEEASKEITAITLRTSGRTLSFGCGDFVTDDPTITYVKCEDEEDLLIKFINAWRRLSPDVVTGWNIEFFDIPYLVNRISRLFSAEVANLLSPWGIIDVREIEKFEKTHLLYDLAGISTLDYYMLYRKFTFGNQPTYKLDFIAQVELGEKKIDYSEYGSLLKLYKSNFQKFMEYNIHDAVLVDRLEDKLGFIQQTMALAYRSQVNYIDTLTTVRPWDIIIHNYLLDRRYVIPLMEDNSKDRVNIGGFVKEPKVGWSKWVVSFDLKSSYPHNIMQYNISPETFVGKKDIFPSIERLTKGVPFERDDQYAMAANGCFFRKDKQGFLAALMEDLYNERAKFNKMLGEVEKEYEKTKKPELQKEMSKLHNMQMATKIQLNSAYGALANQFFRWFDIDLAEAITTSGQLAVLWVADRINVYLNEILKTENKDYVIASDTDSVYLDLETYVLQHIEETDPIKITKKLDHFCKTEMEPKIASIFADLAEYMNAYQQRMEMTREIIASKGIWTAKKKYILNVYDKKGITYEKPKIKISGIESVRSSTPTVCREKINDAISIIMNQNEEDLQSFIRDFRQEFYKLPFDEVAFPRGVNNMTMYHDPRNIYTKGTPIHVKGALIFNELLKKYNITTIPPIQNGDKIKFASLIEPNPIRQTVIAAPDELPHEFNLDKYIDKDRQFETAFVEPLRKIATVIGWQVEKFGSLDDCF